MLVSTEAEIEAIEEDEEDSSGKIDPAFSLKLKEREKVFFEKLDVIEKNFAKMGEFHKNEGYKSENYNVAQENIKDGNMED